MQAICASSCKADLVAILQLAKTTTLGTHGRVQRLQLLGVLAGLLLHRLVVLAGVFLQRLCMIAHGPLSPTHPCQCPYTAHTRSNERYSALR